jgi:hypothetical protein
MSEIMEGVLRMPPDLWSGDALDVMQRHACYVQAADEITRLRAEVEGSDGQHVGVTTAEHEVEGWSAAEDLVYLPRGTKLYTHAAPVVPEAHNINEVHLIGDSAVKVVFPSCRSASAFMKFILSAAKEAL